MHRRHFVIASAVIAVAVLFSVLAPAAPAQASFPDVPSTHQYYEAIIAMAQRGVITGYEKGGFGPDDPVTREQFAKMIVKTLDLPVSKSDVCPFHDVQKQVGNDPLYPSRYVAVCAASDITTGRTATSFAPEDYITREQVVTMIVRAADSLLQGTLYAAPDDWDGALPYSEPTHGLNIRKAEYNFLMDGMPLQSAPVNQWQKAQATRGEVAQFLWNLMILTQPHEAPAITGITPSGGTAVGRTPVTITGTNFTHVTRVTFGGVETWFHVVSDTQITTASPPPCVTGPGGMVDVQVATRFGTTEATSADLYWYGQTAGTADAPALTAVTPTSGGVGTRVTITGDNLDGATQVMFGGIPAPAFTVVSPREIEALAPAPWTATGGVQPVTVATASGSSQEATAVTFSYEEPGTIAAFTQPVDVPILMYHYVDTSPPAITATAESLTVPSAEFVRQLDYLQSHGYHTVTLDDIYLAAAGVKKLPSKPVALTFDDGALDNYTVVFPILKQYGFTGTFFVVTKWVGSLGCLTWDQLREMSTAGMSIQSHTVTHHDLTALTDARLARELRNSRAAITREIGVPPLAVSYPGGAFNGRVSQAAKDAGYVMAVTTLGQVGFDYRRPFEIGRHGVTPGMSISHFAGLLK